MDYFEELKDIATLSKSMAFQKIILTTTVLDEDEQTAEDAEAFRELKQRFSGDKKCFLIKVKEETR